RSPSNNQGAEFCKLCTLIYNHFFLLFAECGKQSRGCCIQMKTAFSSTEDSTKVRRGRKNDEKRNYSQGKGEALQIIKVQNSVNSAP
ncbi:MAG: hypothetical protein IJT03_06380, partial [Clostridia bacterium]|nr:hypothetical protein [Clostridia bacterium]